jgi:lipooligosaccharide transport system permease protein
MSAVAGVVEYNLRTYRRTWRGSVFGTLLSPMVFLVAMGIGLGSLINRRSGGVEGVPYLLYLAPGLLVANAMQSSLFLTTYTTLSRVRWQRTYEAMLATPVRVRDLVTGELAWVALRMLQGASVFWVAMALFGTVRSPAGVLAIPVAVLTGLAFACPIMAFSATQRSDVGFILLQRLVMVPLFLFGGVFFPLDRLPLPLQAVAWAAPLPHGVVLARGLTLGTLSPGSAWPHLAVLGAYAGGGALAAWISLRRRLER